MPPFPGVPPGYVRAPDATLTPGPTEDAPHAVRQAFEMRAEGATVRELQAFLRSHGIERTDATVRRMLANRVYLGELRFGTLVNREAHEPIIDSDLFERVQRMTSSRGRVAHSDRLLARLGVLRCGTCGSRLVVGSSSRRGRTYPTYKCHSGVDCARKVAIGAKIAESVVTEAVQKELSDVEGRASAAREAREAVRAEQNAQADLDAAIRAFASVESERAAIERLAQFREIRDRARETAHRLSHLSSALVIRADADWDRLTREEQRALIRAVVERAIVRPGRGTGRITVVLFSEDPTSG